MLTALDIQDVLAGDLLKLRFNDRLTDSRTPDLIVLPTPGAIFTGSAKKVAEHCGFSCAHCVASRTAEENSEIPRRGHAGCPTILEALRIDPEELLAVRKEKNHASYLEGISSS